MVSKNLRDHRGILEHSVSSLDPEYDGLYTKGVAVDILNNDGDYGGYVNVVEDERLLVGVAISSNKSLKMGFCGFL